MTSDPVLDPLADKLRSRADLSWDEAAAAARRLADAAVSDPARVSFLRALSDKGESGVEIAAFARVFGELSRKPPVAEFASRSLDIVGTGGDGAESFNISTFSALIAASAGVPVMKHGGRSVSSRSGSADFLERVGVNLALDDEGHALALKETGFTFFFAPEFHPAFKAVSPARKILAAEGKKTIFNLLGPLVNPGRPAHVMIGVYAERLVEPVAAALDALGVRRGLVVHGTAPGGVVLDELSVCGRCRVKGAGELHDVSGDWMPSAFGLSPAPFSDLRGGDADENFALLQDFLNGGARQGLQDSVVFNAGTALWVAGAVPSVKEGIYMVGDLFESGAVRAHLRRVRDFYSR